MWFLLQLIDHEVHESNEVSGERFGAGPGGLWALGAPISLAQSSRADPNLSSPAPNHCPSRARGGGMGLQAGVWGAAQT